MHPPTPIFDGHNDSIQSTYLGKRGSGVSILDKSDKGHIDIYRTRTGHLIGGFFAIQTPPENLSERAEDYGFHINENGYYIDLPTPLRQGYAEDFVNKVLDYALKLEEQSNKIKIIRKASDLDTKGKELHVLLHLEGAEAVKTYLSNLDDLYQKGVRSIGLFWSRRNAFGTGVQYKFPSTPNIGDGLTEAGKALIKECNRMGVIVDLAHTSEKSFWDAAKITQKPIVVTHTTVNALCPSSRSITNEQIDEVGKSGGVIGILFEPMMINSFGLKLPVGKTLEQVFTELRQTPLSAIVKHIDYIAQRIGIDHVALGADMEGAIMPDALKDASEYQNLVKELYNFGYDTTSIKKICFGNWFRVINATIR